MKRIIGLLLLITVALLMGYGLRYEHALQATGNGLLGSQDDQMVFIGEPQPHRRNIILAPTIGSTIRVETPEAHP